MEYTISLTESQQKAMEYIAVDVEEWITNAVQNRSRIAIDEICSLYTNYKIEKNEPITVVGKDNIVLAAYEEDVIKTAAEQNIEMQQEIAADS